MKNVLIALVVLTVLGAVFGMILAFAAKVFAVKKDPREEAIAGCLPGANCGGCGFPGCGGYAAAVVAGTAPVNACAAGGVAVAAKIAEIMGVAAGDSVKKIAAVRCTGCGVDFSKYNYEGVKDCLAASRLPGGGPLGCDYGCLGMGTCEKVCPFDAIHVKNGVAVVDEEKCKACGKCVDVCPRHIIALEPYKTRKHVAIPCSSQAKGAVVTKVCTNGCIGCSLCAKACPKEAITVENFLAKIDYDKCVGCGICATKCPRHLITVEEPAKPAVPVKPVEKAEPAPKAEVKVPETVEEVIETPAPTLLEATLTEPEVVQTAEAAATPVEGDPTSAQPQAVEEAPVPGSETEEAFKRLEEAVAAAGAVLKEEEKDEESADKE